MCAQNVTPSTANAKQSIVVNIPYPSVEYFSTYHGVRWNPKLRVNVWYGIPSQLPKELIPHLAKPFSWEEYVQHQLNNTQPSAQAPQEPLKPYAHQIAGIQAITNAYRYGLPGFLLADDVGLGKTLTAWLSLTHIFHKPGRSIAIVAPLSVLPAWRTTIQRMGNPGHNIILVNYDKLRVLYETDPSHKPKSLKGVAKYAKPRKFDAIIWDECHYLKNLTTARSKLALGLYETCSFHIWLSATSGHGPLELGYLMPLLVKQSNYNPPGSTYLKRFEAWYAGQGLSVKRGAFGQWTWDSSLKDCEHIHNLLFKPKIYINKRTNAKELVVGGLRRRPDEIVGWPQLQRIALPIELNNEERKLYEQSWAEFQGQIRTTKKKEEGLVALLRFRMKASLLRVSYTAEHVADLISEGYHVAVSCEFIEPLGNIQQTLEKRGIRCTTIHGQLSVQEREQNRQAFQRGEAQVILFTVKEGIDLYQGQYPEDNTPRAQVDHDIRWSAIAMHQIDGRAHRAGKFAKVYWAYAQDTKEEYVAQTLLKKMEQLVTLNGDESALFDQLAKQFST